MPEQFYMFSPSIDVDSTWLHVKTCVEKEMKANHTDEEPICFDHSDPDARHDILDPQQKTGSCKTHEISNYVR